MMLRTTNNPDRHLDLGPGAASGTGAFSGSLVVAESEAARDRRHAREHARREAQRLAQQRYRERHREVVRERDRKRKAKAA